MVTILVVDDEQAIVEDLCMILELEGYDTQSAFNGKTAFARIQQSPPDIVLSDIRMPEMDGNALLRAIRSDDSLDSVRFVFFTATKPNYDDPNIRADAILPKPAPPLQLIDTIEKLLRN